MDSLLNGAASAAARPKPKAKGLRGKAKGAGKAAAKAPPKQRDTPAASPDASRLERDMAALCGSLDTLAGGPSPVAPAAAPPDAE
eukprot:4956211-Pyramimonas_sp.AAC.1